MSVLNSEITPPNPADHDECIRLGMGRSHSVNNCFLVHPWLLDQTQLNKRARIEFKNEDGLPAEEQLWKWRKASHRKEQGKELDRVQQAHQELHE